LLQRSRPRAMAVCSRMLPCREDAEEACQDALLQVARHITSFHGSARFTTWLHTIASNSARMTYRTLLRRAAERPAADQLVERPDPRTTSVIAGTRLDLLDALEVLDTEQPEFVQPFVLRDVCQLSYPEIAEHLGLPLGTVKGRIHHARQRIRSRLAG